MLEIIFIIFIVLTVSFFSFNKYININNEEKKRLFGSYSNKEDDELNIKKTGSDHNSASNLDKDINCKYKHSTLKCVYESLEYLPEEIVSKIEFINPNDSNKDEDLNTKINNQIEVIINNYVADCNGRSVAINTDGRKVNDSKDVAQIFIKVLSEHIASLLNLEFQNNSNLDFKFNQYRIYILEKIKNNKLLLNISYDKYLEFVKEFAYVFEFKIIRFISRSNFVKAINIELASIIFKFNNIFKIKKSAEEIYKELIKLNKSELEREANIEKQQLYFIKNINKLDSNIIANMFLSKNKKEKFIDEFFFISANVNFYKRTWN